MRPEHSSSYKLIYSHTLSMSSIAWLHALHAAWIPAPPDQAQDPESNTPIFISLLAPDWPMVQPHQIFAMRQTAPAQHALARATQCC